MPDFILLMHNDAVGDVSAAAWPPYLEGLRAAGRLRGGSAIGDGACFRRNQPPARVTADIVGFVRLEAEDLAEAARLLEGNPVYEAGGTVEIRELPAD